MTPSLFRSRQTEQEKSPGDTQSHVKHSLRELCPDEEIYSAAARSLYLDPEGQLPATSIDNLTSDAEDALRRDNYKNAFLKFRMVFDKAVFEATRHPEKRAHYSKTAKEAISKALTAAEHSRSEDEFVEGLRILSRRLDEFVSVAAAYYSEGSHR